MVVANVKTFLTGLSVTLLAAGLSGQTGHRYLRRGFAAPEYGTDGMYDQGKYAIGQVHLHASLPPANLQGHAGPGYPLQVPGWNGYQGASVFNPYQKAYHLQNQGFYGNHQLQQPGFAVQDGQMFGVPQQLAAATGFVGNRRLRMQ